MRKAGLGSVFNNHDEICASKSSDAPRSRRNVSLVTSQHNRIILNLSNASRINWRFCYSLNARGFAFQLAISRDF